MRFKKVYLGLGSTNRPKMVKEKGDIFFAEVSYLTNFLFLIFNQVALRISSKPMSINPGESSISP